MSAPIRIVIRADAGRDLGTGHLARAAALVAPLRRAGGEPVLVTGADGARFVLAQLPEDVATVVVPDSETPAETLRRLTATESEPGALCLDQYGEVAAWEAACREAGVRMMVMDDLDAAATADIIVRPHEAPGTIGDPRYLRGPDFVPLSQMVRDPARNPAVGETLQLNICFGGTDPTGETEKAIVAVEGLEGVAIDLVVGPGSEVDAALLDVARSRAMTRIHAAPPKARMIDLLARADFALGAGGLMLWERACLGLPSLVVAVADNQIPQIERMAELGAIAFLGSHGDVDANTMAAAVRIMMQEGGRRAAMADVARKTVDGRGADRLASALIALAQASAK